MIIEKVEFKYSKGDKVHYTKNKNYVAYWRTPNSSVPVTEREYTIDGYGFDVTSEGIQKWYLFHAYCDDYFEYHEKVNEELLEPVTESTQNIISDLHFVDTFGEELEIGDTVYDDVYAKINGYVSIHSLAFFKKGNVKGFRFAENDFYTYRMSILLENCQNSNGTYTPYNGAERYDSICKTLPDKKTIIQDILKENHFDFKSYSGDFDALYGSSRKGLEFLGITQDEFNEVWKEFKEIKKSKKKSTTKKKTAKKSKTDEELLEKLSKMSAKDKKKLLKLLQEND